jgi:hypothetical protein
VHKALHLTPSTSKQTNKQADCSGACLKLIYSGNRQDDLKFKVSLGNIVRSPISKINKIPLEIENLHKCHLSQKK